VSSIGTWGTAAMISARVRSLLGQNSRSPAPRPKPIRWLTRSRTVTISLSPGFDRLNPGRYVRTGSSHPTLPSSIRMASAAQVTALVLEATANRVCSSTAAPPMARTP